MINVVIIAGQNDLLDRITPILSKHNSFCVAAHGKDVYDAIKLTSAFKPNIVITGNHMAFIDGEEISPILRAQSPKTATVIVAKTINDTQLHKAIINNISGIIHEEADMDFLPWILKRIADGACFISPSFTNRVLRLTTIANPCPNADDPQCIETIARMLAKHSKKATAARDSIEHLSRTDLEILTHIGKGETSAEIAESLNLATTTVRNYISAVLHKTGLRNRTQMVRYALEHGLVPFSG